MTTRGCRTTSRVASGVLAALLLGTALTASGAVAQDDIRVGDDVDPIRAAIAINQAKADAPAYAGPSKIAVIGRSDVFADNLAATALAGSDGVLLLTDGGPAASLPDEVLDELQRTMAAGQCQDGQGPTVFLAGGTQAVSVAAQEQLDQTRFCVTRLSGPSRIETAIAVAQAVPDPSSTVLLARADDWADAGAIGSYAAASGSRVLVTSSEELHPLVAAALQQMAPERIVVLGGTAALSPEVEQAAKMIAPTQRVQGPARDGTAVAIATQLGGQRASGDVALADGYDDQAWTYLFAGAGLAALRDMPVLYTQDDLPTPATQAYLDNVQPTLILRIGPAQEPAPDLGDVDVALQPVARLQSPLMLKVRPETGELWVVQREGQILALTGTEQREVLDISATVGTTGEGGLLGLAFDPPGQILYTSSTDTDGNSVIDAFDVVGDVVDAATRRQLLQVDQPAANHNGGDLQWGPDGYLWWSLGDGGGGNDKFGNGQDPSTLLASLVRIDPAGDPYAIPPDNPFADGAGGAEEVWAYGLRNPFRFDFDDVTGDLYIADVGQSEVEEIDYVASGTGAGSNFGWSVFEGTRRFRDGEVANHVPPVWEEYHTDGNCSITGGVVYRGQAIPDLDGAYLYSDFCTASIRAILVTDGQVSQAVDLGVAVERPVGFGTDADGEVYVLSNRGDVVKLVPA